MQWYAQNLILRNVVKIRDMTDMRKKQFTGQKSTHWIPGSSLHDAVGYVNSTSVPAQA